MTNAASISDLSGLKKLSIGLLLVALTLLSVQCGEKVEEADSSEPEVQMTAGPLETKLAERREKSMADAPAEVLAIGQRFRDSLMASGILQASLNVGDTAPSFALANAVGDTINSSDLLASGAIVLTFYRGDW